MLILREEKDDILYGVWKQEETKEELLSALYMEPSIAEILDSIDSEHRQMEMLAVRVLLKELLGEQKEIGYFETGRPYLVDGSYNIGISHTRGYVSVVLHPFKRVAIDIQEITEKIKRVESRLISPIEYIDESQKLIHLLLHFSCKESMFKVLDEEGVDFIEHLSVEPFTPSPRKHGIFRARERKTPSKHEFDEVNYLIDEDFVLVWLSL